MEPVDRSGGDLAVLVAELDARLGRSGPYRSMSTTGPDGIVVLPPRPLRGLPAWVVFAGLAIVLIGAGWLILKPGSGPCAANDDICQIAQLDIDALRVTIPDSALMARLPNIDALDPDDVLTAGDIFEMQGLRAEDLAQLLSREEIDLLLDRND